MELVEGEWFIWLRWEGEGRGGGVVFGFVRWLWCSLRISGLWSMLYVHMSSK